MHPTRTSLLLRVKDLRDATAWQEFHNLYAPLIYAYARARGLNHDDAEEVRSTCYESLVRQLPGFEYDKSKGGFKAWLGTMAHRRVIDFLRRRGEAQADSSDLDQLPDPAPGADKQWDQSWRRQHLAFCVDKVQSLVSEQTSAVFRMLVDEDCTVPEVCTQLGINTNQVYKAKARVLALIREEMALLDLDASLP